MSLANFNETRLAGTYCGSADLFVNCSSEILTFSLRRIFATHAKMLLTCNLRTTVVQYERLAKTK
jgi:hypothetical protein